jgi:hypothetical protein
MVATMKQCPYCGHLNRANTVVCNGCAKVAPGMNPAIDKKALARRAELNQIFYESFTAHTTFTSVSASIPNFLIAGVFLSTWVSPTMFDVRMVTHVESIMTLSTAKH